MNKRALIAMSGGVDSSVAAFLIKSEGFESMGVTMKLFANEDIGISIEHSCCSLATWRMPAALHAGWEYHITFLISPTDSNQM